MEQLGEGLHALQDKEAHLDWGTRDYNNPISEIHRTNQGNRDVFDDPSKDIGYGYESHAGNVRINKTETATKDYLRDFLNAIG